MRDAGLNGTGEGIPSDFRARHPVTPWDCLEAQKHCIQRKRVFFCPANLLFCARCFLGSADKYTTGERSFWFKLVRYCTFLYVPVDIQQISWTKSARNFRPLPEYDEPNGWLERSAFARWAVSGEGVGSVGMLTGKRSGDPGNEPSGEENVYLTRSLC